MKRTSKRLALLCAVVMMLTMLVGAAQATAPVVCNLTDLRVGDVILPYVTIDIDAPYLSNGTRLDVYYYAVYDKGSDSNIYDNIISVEYEDRLMLFTTRTVAKIETLNGKVALLHLAEKVIEVPDDGPVEPAAAPVVIATETGNMSSPVLSRAVTLRDASGKVIGSLAAGAGISPVQIAEGLVRLSNGGYITLADWLAVLGN